ncbi:MAG: pirin family protein [Actinobacteria bacterium]|nr:pirin family protein [Actinomycetota bacterium]
MEEARKVQEVFPATPTIEGAGVHLKRAFGFHQVPKLDPFLLLDEFHSSDPADYSAGFPWHPHRGIETVTYMLRGVMEHRDSMGNGGAVGPGDVQWMTAGSGIIHQEMPRGEGELWGLQLWTNLPADHKMMVPRYQEVKAMDIPAVDMPDGTRIRIISGQVAGVIGPVRDIVTAPEYLDVSMTAGSTFQWPTPTTHTVFAYVLEGRAEFGDESPPTVDAEQAALFGAGGKVALNAGDEPLRFLLISARPLGEPVAWEGPVVMNRPEELRQAFQEYRDGTFIKRGAVGQS